MHSRKTIKKATKKKTEMEKLNAQCRMTYFVIFIIITLNANAE